MRLRPQSELGWLMLQWLAVLVLGHNVQADPSLLRGSRRAGKTLELKRAEPLPLIECGCCKRTVTSLDGAYLVCGPCAECLSLGHCYDPAEGDHGHNVTCCHGVNHFKDRALRPGEVWDESGAVTHDALAMLAHTGTIVIDTQPPPEPDVE